MGVLDLSCGAEWVREVASPQPVPDGA